MKKKLILICLIYISSAIFASEVSDLLLEAKTAYESGDVSIAIQKLDSAKSLMEKEQLSSSADDYVEITSWDIVKLKKADYLGTKIKIMARFGGVNSDGTIYIPEVYISNPYEESLIDKILSLKEYEKYYVFYGTVTNGVLGPVLHVEAIE